MRNSLTRGRSFRACAQRIFACTLFALISGTPLGGEVWAGALGNLCSAVFKPKASPLDTPTLRAEIARTEGALRGGSVAAAFDFSSSLSALSALEAASSLYFGRVPSLVALAQSPNATVARRARALAERWSVSVSKVMTPARLDALAGELAALATLHAQGASWWPALPRRALEQSVNQKIIETDLIRALKKLGAVDPQRFARQSVRYQKLARVWGAAKLGANALLNLASLRTLGLPWGPPALRLNSAVFNDPVLLRLVRDRGFDGAYPLLQRHWGLGERARFEFAYRVATRAWHLYLWSQIAASLLSVAGEMSTLESAGAEPAGAAPDAGAAIPRRVESAPGSDESFRAQIRIFAALFYETNGRWPQLELASDRSQWEAELRDDEALWDSWGMRPAREVLDGLLRQTIAELSQGTLPAN